MEMRKIMRPYDNDWNNKPDSLGRYRLTHRPRRFWVFPKTKRGFQQLLEALLDAVDPWSECVVVFDGRMLRDDSLTLEVKTAKRSTIEIPLSEDLAACFDASERDLMLRLLAGYWKSSPDIDILPDHRRQTISLSHHDVAHVEFADRARIPAFVAAMAERGLPLPKGGPDWTFKPQTWFGEGPDFVGEKPFEFAEGEPIVPWQGSVKNKGARDCAWDGGPQYETWMNYWSWRREYLDYPEEPERFLPFIENVVAAIDPFREVIVAILDPEKEKVLCFDQGERSQLVEWLARYDDEFNAMVIPQHGRDWLRFLPTYRRVDAAFSEPLRHDRLVRLLAQNGFFHSVFSDVGLPWKQQSEAEREGPCAIHLTFDPDPGEYLKILRVGVSQPPGFLKAQLTQGNGFRADRFPVGSHWLGLNAEGTPFVSRWYKNIPQYDESFRKADPIELQPGKNEITIVLERGRTISGRIIQGDESSGRYGWVAAWRLDLPWHRPSRVCPFWPGRYDYRIEGLDPGRYRLQLTVEPQTSQKQRLTVAEVDVLDTDVVGLDIALPPVRPETPVWWESLG